MDDLEKVRGVLFNWNERSESLGHEVGRRDIGVIAQELEQVYPELVNTGSDGYKAVDYSKLTAVLIEGMKEQQREIEALQVAVAGLEERMVETTHPQTPSFLREGALRK